MSEQPNKKGLFLDALVFRAMVPKAYRSPEDFESDDASEAIDDKQPSESEVSRLMSRIFDVSPDGDATSSDDCGDSFSVASEAHELSGMCRGRGDELPEDVEEKLRKIREEAKRRGDDRDSND
ncbi:MAG: hypothetical protein AAF532_07635 [Planctomycetota bacterium]